jgi:hypothetical protein
MLGVNSCAWLLGVRTLVGFGSDRSAKKKEVGRTYFFFLGGEGGIRTLGTVAGTTVFKTVSFNHSDTSPDVVAKVLYHIC